MFASKEVVLSAGTVGTPQILLLSGIGDPDALSAVGITPLHNLPSVGRNVSDQPVSRISWQVNSTDTEDSADRNSTLAALLEQQWEDDRSGPLVTSPINEIAFLRVKNTSLLETFGDPAAGPNTAHIELLMLVCDCALSQSLANTTLSRTIY